jgi:hypothetical protein
VIAGAEKNTAGCARRRLGKVPEDSGSNPDISKVIQVFRKPEWCWRSLLQNAPTAQPLGAFFISGLTSTRPNMIANHRHQRAQRNTEQAEKPP